MQSRSALRRMLKHAAYREHEKLDVCAVHNGASNSTVCSICLSCMLDIIARRKANHTYKRAEKRRKLYAESNRQSAR